MDRTALILAPHPDDESIIGLLPLRLREECGFTVWVVPATLGSRPDRRAQRKKELAAACALLGFRLRFLEPKGPPMDSAEELRGLLEKLVPSVVFIPHAMDGHPTHRVVHRLALAAMDASRIGTFQVVETEYWHPIERPNLMVAGSRRAVAKLRQALSCHAGEIRRNDYAARLSAWMVDNVRRGAELVGGKGASAPPFSYATLYRARRRVQGAWRKEFAGGRIVRSRADLESLADRWK